MENELLEKLKAIFGFTKVTFNLQADLAKEQNTLFVELEQPVNRFAGGVVNTRVSGSAVLYAAAENIKLGAMAKAVDSADPALTKDFFFQDLDGNTRVFQDIVGRGFSFTYFFRGQFNPPSGKITEVDFKE